MTEPSRAVYNLYGDCGVVTVTEKYAARDPEEEIKKVGQQQQQAAKVQGAELV